MAWDIRTADDVAQALDWLRRRMGGNGLVLVAIGTNSVAYSKDVALAPDDAAELIEANMPALRRGFDRLKSERVTRGSSKREDI